MPPTESKPRKEGHSTLWFLQKLLDEIWKTLFDKHAKKIQEKGQKTEHIAEGLKGQASSEKASYTYRGEDMHVRFWCNGITGTHVTAMHVVS